MPEFSDTIVGLGRQLLTRAASEQGGVISGDNPSHYNASNPIRLWIIQAIVIIGFTQILSLGLSRIRQPRVIAEVIAGILLGPTVMGRIPNFTQTIFPKDSIPLLTLVANIGLTLFLFLVGLEIDGSTIKRNARAAMSISAAGIVLPFGMGAAVAVPIYNTFIDKENVSFGHFILFVAVAISITAFPVLCRILSELHLFDTNVGVVVLSAGVGNDVVGWILLALVVALVNGGAGLTALYILLAAVGFTLFLLFPLRWAFYRLARWTGSLETGQPTPLLMTMTFLLIFGSAFFTDIIGVHAIFGGFLAGLVIPREGGLDIALVEKIEDIVSILFLPLYFTLSGLKTNLGLLDDGRSWGYTVLICVIAFFGKFLGCAIVAKFTGFNNREATAIGTLMSCKGLVELIVLNIGLQAGILDTRVFSMFVIHAIILTCMTTPLTIWAYPARVRNHLSSRDKKTRQGDQEGGASRPPAVDGLKTRFTVVLHRMEYLPAVMSLVRFLQPPISSLPSSTSGSSDKEKSLEITSVTLDGTPRVSIEALRLIELTGRTSAVMKSTLADGMIQRDAVLNVFRTFALLNRIPVTSTLSILQLDEFSSTVAEHAKETGSDLVIIPWSTGVQLLEEQTSQEGGAVTAHNPFEALFGKQTPQDKASSVLYTQFIRRVFAESPSDVALFFDHGLAGDTDAGVYGQHIILPFFGGPDDRLALSFVVQLCAHPAITATVIRVKKTESVELDTSITTETVDPAKLDATTALSGHNLTVHSTSGFPDTLYPNATTQTRVQSDMADNIAWEKYASNANETSPHTPAIVSALARVTFEELGSPTPLRAILDRTEVEVKKAYEQSKSVFAVVGRARRQAVESHMQELRVLLNEQNATTSGGEVRKTLGEVACAFVVSKARSNLLVVQAAAGSTD